MSSTKSASNYKAKKYFKKQNNFGKRPCIEPNSKGFLCSCNSREKDCVKESYNLLNEYADKLYPSPQLSKAAEAEEDISESLAKELVDLQSTDNKKRFQLVDAGAKNFLFIKTTLPNPAELVEAIVKDIHESGIQKTKFLLRLVPVETTCKATIPDICDAFLQIAERHFRGNPQTFSIIFNHRNNNSLSRDDVIKAVADKVATLGSHKVDLKNAKLCVVIEIAKAVAFLSIVPDYLKYKKYNLFSICEKEKSVE